MCGACVGVCPAYLLTKDERVTARGKLLTARKMDTYGAVTKEHATCDLPVHALQGLRAGLPVEAPPDPGVRGDGEAPGRAARQGRRDDQDGSSSWRRTPQHYDALVDRGLVLGSPGKNVEGGN